MMDENEMKKWMKFVVICLLLITVFFIGLKFWLEVYQITNNEHWVCKGLMGWIC